MVEYLKETLTDAEYAALWPATKEERDRRLDEALARVEAAGDQWDQSAWLKVTQDDMPEEVWTNAGRVQSTLEPGDIVYVCGTARCVAGHVAASRGYTHAVVGDIYDPVPAATPSGVYYFATAANPHTHERVDVELYAAHHLGLTREQAQCLFFPSNTLERLRADVANIKAAPLVPCDCGTYCLETLSHG